MIKIMVCMGVVENINVIPEKHAFTEGAQKLNR